MSDSNCVVHLNDIGTVFELTIKDCFDKIVDISSATTRNIIFKKPDGTTITKTGVFTTDGTDGKLQYITIASDMDQLAEWKIQAFVIITAGEFSSSSLIFEVVSNL